MTEEQQIYVLELEEALAQDQKGEKLHAIKESLDAELALVNSDIHKGLPKMQFVRLDALRHGLEAAKSVVQDYWLVCHSHSV